ncbi:MAG TPA: hypothetical protein VJG85_01340, partial [Patescibacteria group bacterium]|nr:hypothetical protein [Patescibacteria group bacterium]
MNKLGSVKPFIILFGTLLFLTPIIFSSNTRELFEFPKMFFVYFLGTSLIYLFLLRIVLSRSKYKFRFPLLKYAAVFVVIYIIASFLSDHFYTSLWGYYTRFNGGLVSVLVFFGLYVVAVNVLKREDVSFLVNVVLVSVIP